MATSITNKTPLFGRKQSGGMFSVVNESVTTGNIFWVDSGATNGADSAGAGVNPDVPFLTWAYAVAACTPNNGDIIYLMPGHAETIATSTVLDINIAGVRTIGLGDGNDRPTFTVNGVAGATITFSAASCSAKNIIVVGGLDGLNTAITVTGVGVDLDIEYRDTSSTVEADIAIACTGDKFRCKLRDIGFTAGDQRDQSITLNGVDNARIDIDFYGKVATAVVDMISAACTDVEVKGYFYVSGTTDLSKNVKDSITGSTWFVEGYDGAAGAAFSGGSGNAVAVGDLSVIASDVRAINSDVNIVQSDIKILDPIIDTIKSDLIVADALIDTIKSDLIVADALIDTIKSDLIITQSDVKIIDTVTDTIKSDLIVADAIVDTIKSDLIVADAIVDTIKSDLIVADAIVDTIKSDLIVADALIDTIKSDLIISQSDIKVIDPLIDTIKSDIIVLDPIIDTIKSDLIITQSDIKVIDPLIDTIKSDLIVADALIDTIKSDLIVADALIDTIKSDLIVVQPGIERLVLKTYANLTGYDTAPAFTVTGDVMVQVVGVVGATAITSTSGTTTLAIGTTELTTGIIGATTIDNTQFAATDVWVDTSPANDVEIMSSAAWAIIGDGADIILTRSVDDITAGSLTLYCWWKALSAGATVVSA